MSGTRYLLDTHAFIWLAQGIEIAAVAREKLQTAAMRAPLLVSPITAWELGLLAHPRGNRRAVTFDPDVKSWYSLALQSPSIAETQFTADIALDAALLPGDMHGDPADRLLTATARRLGATLVTRDSALHAYARQGHLKVLAC